MAKCSSTYNNLFIDTTFKNYNITNNTNSNNSGVSNSTHLHMNAYNNHYHHQSQTVQQNFKYKSIPFNYTTVTTSKLTTTTTGNNSTSSRNSYVPTFQAQQSVKDENKKHNVNNNNVKGMYNYHTLSSNNNNTNAVGGGGTSHRRESPCNVIATKFCLIDTNNAGKGKSKSNNTSTIYHGSSSSDNNNNGKYNHNNNNNDDNTNDIEITSVNTITNNSSNDNTTNSNSNSNSSNVVSLRSSIPADINLLLSNTLSVHLSPTNNNNTSSNNNINDVNHQLQSPVLIDINDLLGKSAKHPLSLTLLSKTFPSFPKTRTSTRTLGSIRAYGANTYKGIVRNYNEDCVHITINSTKPKTHPNTNQWPSAVSFFAVFDGHGGQSCSEFLRDNLFKYICHNEYFPLDIDKAIRHGFAVAESEFLKKLALDQSESSVLDRSGSCAIALLVVGKRCYIANVGDSRAVMSRCNGNVITEITTDHKPNHSQEKKRIEMNGGKVYQSKTPIPNLNINQLLVGPYRVTPGRLSVSRTIGDVEAKHIKFGGLPGVIIAEPEIFSYDLNKEDIDFFILGCDGIFDQMTSKEVVDCVWMVFKNEEGTIHDKCGKAVDLILKTAMIRKSFDNVTCVLVIIKDDLDSNNSSNNNVITVSSKKQHNTCMNVFNTESGGPFSAKKQFANTDHGKTSQKVFHNVGVFHTNVKYRDIATKDKDKDKAITVYGSGSSNSGNTNNTMKRKKELMLNAGGPSNGGGSSNYNNALFQYSTITNTNTTSHKGSTARNGGHGEGGGNKNEQQQQRCNTVKDKYATFEVERSYRSHSHKFINGNVGYNNSNNNNNSSSSNSNVNAIHSNNIISQRHQSARGISTTTGATNTRMIYKYNY